MPVNWAGGFGGQRVTDKVDNSPPRRGGPEPRKGAVTAKTTGHGCRAVGLLATVACPSMAIVLGHPVPHLLEGGSCHWGYGHQGCWLDPECGWILVSSALAIWATQFAAQWMSG